MANLLVEQLHSQYHPSKAVKQEQEDSFTRYTFKDDSILRIGKEQINQQFHSHAYVSRETLKSCYMCKVNA